jgi:hypothetical protein
MKSTDQVTTPHGGVAPRFNDGRAGSLWTISGRCAAVENASENIGPGGTSQRKPAHATAGAVGNLYVSAERKKSGLIYKEELSWRVSCP